MKKASLAALLPLGFLPLNTSASGVSPYLPLNLDPEIERQIERVLMLADRAVLTRPIATATVLEALPAVCPRDPVLCQSVRRYLDRYMRTWGLTEATIEGATSSGSDRTVPNRHGLSTASDWAASASGFWQPSDYMLISAGAVAYEGRTTPTGSMLSVGWNRAQLDIGYRDHWMSPMRDSSMLLGTEAATMPSVTLSNYTPLTRWAFHYEAFVASMSRSDGILFEGETVSGTPQVSGIHLSMEPARGWSLGVNRLLQYGGGGRPESFNDMLRAFFDPASYDNTNAALTSDEQFGNQLASITSQFLFPGKVPFSVYFEYAGEDTSHGSNYLLGNSALSAGIHFPTVWRRFDLTYEVSEWQNGWYVNGVYGDGLTNHGNVLGHWGGDQRVFADPVGGQSHMLRVGWEPSFGGLLEMRYRTLANERYTGVPYERGYDATLRYSRPVKGFTVGGEVFAGRDVFGESFSRVAAFIRYSGDSAPVTTSLDYEPVTRGDNSAEIFIDAGVNANRVKVDLDGVSPTTRTSLDVAPHFAIGARRAVSDRSDLGARLEVDSVNESTLIGVRAIDYRYRFANGNPLALNVFIGAARYDLETPAYGIYFGTGVQWRNVLPGWDVGLDLRYHKKIARDHLLPSDPVSEQNDSFYDVTSSTLSLTRRF